MRYTKNMRTTLELEDEVVHAAKQLARQRGATMGEVVSQLIRQGLEAKNPPRVRNGVPLFVPKPGAPKPDLALVNRLRDEE
jgi:hypothetical protein